MAFLLSVWYYRGMKDYEIGSRVGAISGTEGEPGTIHIFGFGTYVGNEVPSTAGGVFGKAMTEIAEFTPESIPVPDYLKNPKIVLDNGKVVWGCECWWGPEEVIRKRLENYSNIVVVDIDAERAKYAAA